MFSISQLCHLPLNSVGFPKWLALYGWVFLDEDSEAFKRMKVSKVRGRKISCCNQGWNEALVSQFTDSELQAPVLATFAVLPIRLLVVEESDCFKK